MTSEESLPDVAERFGWVVCQGRHGNGSRRWGEHDQGTTLSIESVTETAVTTVLQPQADVRYSQYFDLDSEEKSMRIRLAAITAGLLVCASTGQ